MEIFVVVFAVFTIIAGLAMLGLILAAAIVGRNIDDITYSPGSENETEYGLRTLLFMYPNAVIHTPKNEISSRLKSQNTRIITHPEI